MIEILSLWRNDENRNLDARVEHLLAKTGGDQEIRWLWGVGDSDDGTEQHLRAIAAADPRVRVISVDSGIRGEVDIVTRFRRLSMSATVLFSQVDAEAALCCLHESDILSPPDVVKHLARLHRDGMSPVAAWPTINITGEPQFYDTWAFRDCDGAQFTERRRAPECPFQVGSFGTLWLASASLVRNRAMRAQCVVELCQQWRGEGVALWCDPRLVVSQPLDTWKMWDTGGVAA